MNRVLCSRVIVTRVYSSLEKGVKGMYVTGSKEMSA